VNGYARNIRIIGGTTYSWKGILGNPIRIEKGAQHVSIENMHLFDNVGENPLDTGAAALLNVDPGATDVRVSIIDQKLSASGETIYRRWERSFGTVGELVPASYDATVGHVNAYGVMTTGAGGQIRTLIQGAWQAGPPLNAALPSVGRLLTLLGTGSGVSLINGGNIKFAAGHLDWSGLANTTIQLLYDGAHWLEVVRSDTP
jgi:hypothetical protein